MKRPLLVVGVALLLALMAAPICLLLGYIYTEWCRIPVEGLSFLGFTFATMVITFLLAVPYNVIGISILERKTALRELSQFVVVLVTGAVILTLAVAVFLPCLPEPYFVGGYLFSKLVNTP